MLSECGGLHGILWYVKANPRGAKLSKRVFLLDSEVPGSKQTKSLTFSHMIKFSAQILMQWRNDKWLFSVFNGF